MINFDDVTKEKINKYNQNWPQMPCHLYKVLIIGVSGFGKTNALLNLIKKNKMMIITMLLTKLIYILKILLKQNFDILITKWKHWFQKIEQSKDSYWIFK